VLFICATAFEDGILERSGMSPEDEARYWADLPRRASAISSRE
jgi:hypothetical protein